MEFRLNREIKAFCPDFTPIRRALRGLEATFIEVKHQVDFFYHLPPDAHAAGTRRLKLRFEEEGAQVIYYCDRQENGARTSQFQLWEVTGATAKEILDTALGVRIIVHKQREVWRKDNVTFNLDTAEGVGQVLEVEAQVLDKWDPDQQVQEYRRLSARIWARTLLAPMRTWCHMFPRAASKLTSELLRKPPPRPSRNLLQSTGE